MATTQDWSNTLNHYRNLSGYRDFDQDGTATNPGTGLRETLYARVPNDGLTEDYSDFRFDNPGNGYVPMSGLNPGYYTDNSGTFDQFMERLVGGGLAALGAVAGGAILGGPGAAGTSGATGTTTGGAMNFGFEIPGLSSFGDSFKGGGFGDIFSMASSATGGADMGSFSSFSAPLTSGGGFMPGGMPGSSAGFGDPLSAIMSMASGMMGMDRGRRTRNRGQDAIERSDPFGPHRGRYIEMLNQLYMDPSRVESLPGYKAGLNAVERKMASQGYLGSGNMMLALHDYGGKMFDAEANRLAMLGGAGMKPDVDAMMRAERDASELESQGLGSMGFGLSQFGLPGFGGGSGGMDPAMLAQIAALASKFMAA